MSELREAATQLLNWWTEVFEQDYCRCCGQKSGHNPTCYVNNLRAALLAPAAPATPAEQSPMDALWDDSVLTDARIVVSCLRDVRSWLTGQSRTGMHDDRLAAVVLQQLRQALQFAERIVDRLENGAAPAEPVASQRDEALQAFVRARQEMGDTWLTQPKLSEVFCAGWDAHGRLWGAAPEERTPAQQETPQ